MWNKVACKQKFAFLMAQRRMHSLGVLITCARSQRTSAGHSDHIGSEFQILLAFTGPIYGCGHAEGGPRRQLKNRFRIQGLKARDIVSRHERKHNSASKRGCQTVVYLGYVANQQRCSFMQEVPSSH